MKHLLLTTIAAVLVVGTAFADPIHDAAESGDLAGVQAELDKGANVNAKNQNGATPLHRAAWFGHKEIVELLIAKGADVNAKDDSQSSHYVGTPLNCAAWEGHKEIAELLIDNGADVNAKSDWFERTPLHDAIWEVHKEVIELLIAKGADVNAKDHRARTPLHIAAQKGHKETVELLIAKGAKVNTKDYFDKTPLDRAEEVNEADSAELKAAKKEIADLLRKHELNQLMPRLVQHGRFAFSFDANEGKIYEVQSSQDLRSWGTLKTYNGTGTLIRFEDERDQVFPQIYYRVRVAE